VPEGLSAAEVGKEIAEHNKHDGAGEEADDRDRWLSILEAVLLSLVAVLAAYSGYAAAKWSTDSSVTLAKATAARTRANRADIEGIVTRTLLRVVQCLVHRLRRGQCQGRAFSGETDAPWLPSGV